MSPPPISARAAVRAALITAALFVHGVAASPLPRSAKAHYFDNPIAKEELKRWSGVLSRVGVEMNEEELKAYAMSRGGELADLRKGLLQPFRPLLRVTGTGQGWGLFTYPNSYPHRLHIEVRSGRGEWRTLYRALDPELDWHAPWFRFRRVRGVYDDNATNARSSYNNFVRWMARVAFEEDPEVDELRVFFVRSHVTLPGKPVDTETERRMLRSVKRSQPELVR